MSPWVSISPSCLSEPSELASEESISLRRSPGDRRAELERNSAAESPEADSLETGKTYSLVRLLVVLAYRAQPKAGTAEGGTCPVGQLRHLTLLLAQSVYPKRSLWLGKSHTGDPRNMLDKIAALVTSCEPGVFEATTLAQIRALISLLRDIPAQSNL